MFISFDTSLEDIELLRKEMENFVRQPDNARDFQPDIILEATGIGNMDKLQLKVEIRHKSNWHNETVRASRRSKFMCALVLALRRVPIYPPGGGCEPLGGPNNPGYSVAVSDAWAAEARDKAAKNKEASRLVSSAPRKESNAGKSSGIDLGSATEVRAAETLNARKPTADAAHRDNDQAWSSRDDQTLGSRDESLDRHRSDDSDNLRQGLLKRESTGGRRKPGESVPRMPMRGGAPGFSATQPSPHREGFMGVAGQVLDEEAELGIHSTTASSQALPDLDNENSDLYSGNGYGASGQSANYSVFPPPPSTGSRGAQAQNMQRGTGAKRAGPAS